LTRYTRYGIIFKKIKRVGNMPQKRVGYNKGGIGQLPNDKPVLYRIETKSGKANYVGVAQRGRVQERISEHLSEIPGETVQIEKFNSINDARKKEANVIKRVKPKYNEQGK
jgi:excinuclease UvrABC nuclease subunit